MQGKLPYNYTERLKSNSYKELCFCLTLLCSPYTFGVQLPEEKEQFDLFFFFYCCQDATRKVDIIKEIQSVVMNSEG